MSVETYVSSSDLKRDYMAFSFMCDKEPKENIINGIHNFIDGKEQEAKPEDLQNLSETDKRNNVIRRLQVDSFSDLDQEDAKKIQTEVVVHCGFPRFDMTDIVSLSKAITFVPFVFVNLR